MIKLPLEFFNRRIFHKILGKAIIHVEAPHLSERELLKHLEKYNSTCYCITPINYDYVRHDIGCSLSEKQFHDFLKNFYLTLKKKGINLQLHVHLSQILGKMPIWEKKRLI